jgi:endonuclease/exonuclease/phosphatase family metal-dependent hydrolase
MAWTPASASNTVRVLTFNLRYASAPDGSNAWQTSSQRPERRGLAVSVITTYQPHVIGFQEAETSQIDYLEAQLVTRYAFERQRPSGGSGHEHAAIAYDTNVLSLTDRGVLSLGPAPGGGYWNNTPGTNFAPWLLFPENMFAFPRLALWGCFTWRATTQAFLFTTTHFDTFNSGNDGESQVKSARLIVDNTEARNERMPASPLAIVVGDFNGSQDNRAWKLFTGSYTNNGVAGDFADSWHQVHGTWTGAGTIHGFAGGTVPGGSRIDWILHRGGFVATQCVIVTNAVISTNQSTFGTHILYASDHYPVFASLVLPSPAADFDGDGLPDARELASTNSLPADPDSDNDGLLDGEEDLDGDGQVEGGETHPSVGGDLQRPTDIRDFQMDGILDFRHGTLGSHGLTLYGRFDGRYLYVAVADAGEGSDHFIFVATNPNVAVSAPWAKSGQVGQYVAFLADENDGSFCGWFDGSGNLITNLFTARASTYFENGGRLEGVIDLAQYLGSGFTTAVYLAAAPYGTADGGSLFPTAQVPEGNGDGNIVGTNEYIRIVPGDADGDGIGDTADADSDGDGLPDAWEAMHGAGDAAGDEDGDGFPNRSEYLACTDPRDAESALGLVQGRITNGTAAFSFPVVHARTCLVWTAAGGLSNGSPWTCIGTNVGSVFPVATNGVAVPLQAGGAAVRVTVAP